MLNKVLKSKIYSYAYSRLGLRDYRRGWMKGICPSCGRMDKFGLNLYLNRTNCFVCGYHPSPIKLIMEIEGFSNFQDTLGYLKIYEGKEYLEPKVEKLERIDTVLPEGFKSLIIGNSLLAKSARRYIKKRGFDPEELSYKGWGYCTKGKYFGYIIMPFYVNSKLIYFNARLYMGSGPKYNNPSIEDFGLGKSMVLYNIDALSMYDKVYLAEGVINAETIGEQGIATGGKEIANYQISNIIKSDVDSVVIVLDPDALENAFKLALELSYHKQVKVVILPEGKDINDLGRDEFFKLENKFDWYSYNELLSYYHSLK